MIGDKELKAAIDSAYDAMALLTIAMECAYGLTEGLGKPRNGIVSSMTRLMQITHDQVVVTLNVLEAVEVSRSLITEDA